MEALLYFGRKGNRKDDMIQLKVELYGKIKDKPQRHRVHGGRRV